MIQGRVTTWTVPRRSREGFESEITLEESIKLHVVTQSLDNHPWIAYKGQRVYAQEIVWDSWREGRTSYMAIEDLIPEPVPIIYCNLPVAAITGLRRVEGGAIEITLGDRKITCIDADKSRSILNIGIGGLVRFSNVKVSSHGALYVTATSGVQRVEPPMPPMPIDLPPPPPSVLAKPSKWQCIMCARINFPSKSVCQHCKHTRKEGPMLRDVRGFKLKRLHEPYVFERYPQWMCAHCRHRDNFYFHDVCVKCRKKKKK